MYFAPRPFDVQGWINTGIWKIDDALDDFVVEIRHRTPMLPDWSRYRHHQRRA